MNLGYRRIKEAVHVLPDYSLIEAIKRGSIIDIHDAMEKGATLQARDHNGHCPLEVAQDFEQPSVGRELLRLGADVNQPVGKRGDLLLHRVARTGDIGFATLLLEQGASPDPINDPGKTPLHYAASGGYQFIAEYLIKGGADVNRRTPRGDTPLHLAARRGDAAMIEALLNLNADESLTNNTGYTPLHEAAAAGMTDAVTLLIDRTLSGEHSKAVLLPRVRQAAVLHGHEETAATILAAESYLGSSETGHKPVR